ncbi:MAG: ParB N-terminal domain-containing protein [Rhizobiales bacterium]|nr:ParB N-terminal domain-containing protein [Hyphomicrobiales bacterium]
MNTTIQTIPLNKLILWPGNVRKTAAEDGVAELAASIAAHGLLNPLLIRKDKRGKFAVIAGQRRLLALQRLAQSGRLDADHGVECRVANADAGAAELSLAENVMRTAMHPADEFEAFRDLIDGGASVADVAARFGVPDSRVEKRLKLGRLSPVILNAYRNGDLGLEEAMAFTLSDDHTVQERVFEDLPPWHCKPSAIRRALTPGEIPATDRRVRLIGLDAYQAAGGSVRRDLFDDRNAGYVQDAALLDRLVVEKLDAAAGAVKAEGWLWIESAIDADYAALSRFSRVHPQRGELSDEARAAIDILQAEYDSLAETEDDSDERAARLDEIETRLDEIEASAETWPAETLALAGAIVTVGSDGGIEVKRGLVRPEDSRKAKKAAKAQDASAVPAGEKPLPSTLVADLSAHRSAAISATLMKRPDVALAATVHALALDLFYAYGSDSCLRLSLKRTPAGDALSDPGASKALAALHAERERWTSRLPQDAAQLWPWCLEQKRAALLDLLAVIAASGIDAVIAKGQSPGSARLAHADALIAALKLDVAGWYRPSAHGYFGRIGRPAILAAIEEATGKKAAPAWHKLTRADLAKRAEKMIAPTKWLPAPLRSAAESQPESTVYIDAA